jgi:hypothetical protein
MPELPGEPRLQLSEGCRAGGGGATRQKDFLGVVSNRLGRCPFPSSVDLGAVAFLFAFLLIVAVTPSNANEWRGFLS